MRGERRRRKQKRRQERREKERESGHGTHGQPLSLSLFLYPHSIHFCSQIRDRQEAACDAAVVLFLALDPPDVVMSAMDQIRGLP